MGIPICDDQGNKKWFQYLALLGDVAVTSENNEILRGPLRRKEKYLKEKKLVMNVNKTKIIIFGKGRPQKLTLALRMMKL